MVYVDNAATTYLSKEVIAKMTDFMTQDLGNPSSLHSNGKKANYEMILARNNIAATLGVFDNELTFTSGGTESNNLAIIGFCLANQHLGKHIITSKVEHHSVLDSFEFLRDDYGFEIDFINVLEDGSLNIEQLKSKLRPDTILTSIMFVNNETGVINDIKTIGEILKNHNSVFHVDAVQAFPIMEVKPKLLNIDMLTITAHKLHGPKGVGVLYKSPKIRLQPQMHGGKQENNLRGGTENIIGIVGFGEAVKHLDYDFDYLQFYNYIIETLNQHQIQFKINGKLGLGNILNISFANINRDLLLTKLDMSDVYLSTGSACTAGVTTNSHVLEAMYGTKSTYLNGIRISFSKYTKLSDIKEFTNILITEIKKQQGV